MTAIEEIVGRDPGGRGMRHLAVSGDLYAAASALLSASSGVAVLTGFPCVVGHDIPTENDGLAGAVSIARAALVLGKPLVALVTDECNVRPVTACRDWLLRFGKSIGEDWGERLQLHALPPKSRWQAADTSTMDGVLDRCDHWVAIERAGRASDGSYYTMRKRRMDELVAPLDDWFARAKSSTGIGDGGNELGYGRVESLKLSLLTELTCVCCCPPRRFWLHVPDLLPHPPHQDGKGCRRRCVALTTHRHSRLSGCLLSLPFFLGDVLVCRFQRGGACC